MIKIQNKEDCCGCTASRSVCPEGCISMVADAEGYCYPQVDKNSCVDCHLCEKVCPIINQVSFDEYVPRAYAVQHSDDII